jgi:hypothetical protein
LRAAAGQPGARWIEKSWAHRRRLALCDAGHETPPASQEIRLGGDIGTVRSGRAAPLSDLALEHDQEKWTPVFLKNRAKTNESRALAFLSEMIML